MSRPYPTLTTYPTDCCCGCSPFTDDFDRADGALGNGWFDETDTIPSPDFDAIEIISDAVGSAGSRWAGYRQAGNPSGQVQEISITQDASIHFSSQLGPFAHVIPSMADGHVGLSLYYNILFSRYYLVAATETSRTVYDGTPNTLVQPGTVMIRTDGEQFEGYVDGVRTNPPVPVPAELAASWKAGFYSANTSNDAGDGIVDSFEISCSDDPIGTPPPYPSIVDGATVSEDGGPTSSVTWTGPSTMAVGDDLYVWVGFTGGGTIDNTGSALGSVAVGAQMTDANDFVCALFRLRITAPLAAALPGAALPWAKTGGVAEVGIVIAFVVTDPNDVLPVADSHTDDHDSDVVENATVGIGGPRRAVLWGVFAGDTVTEPAGWTVIGQSSGGEMIMAYKAVTELLVGGTIETGTGSIASSVPFCHGVYTLEPDPTLFT